MEDKILILPVNSQTFEVIEYSTEDTSIIPSFELDTEFSKSSDYIEYYIFDENQNIIFPNSTTELLTYSVRDGHVMIDPKQDLERNGFDEGNYYINYNFYRKHLNSDISNKYYIEEISSNRTEIRLNSTIISNSDIETSTNKFTDYRNTKDYFVDFYLNFGDNNLVIANNIQLDITNETEYSVLIKLYSPLPSNFNLKSQCWVVEKISEDQSYQVKFPIPIFDPQDFEFIAGPNLSLNIKDETGVSSQEYSYDTLINSSITSSNSQIQSLLAEKGLKINVNYENFSNYIKFSSAKTRLENFYYKVGLIENYTNQIATLDSNITSNTSTSTEFSSSKAVFEEQINSIIKNFDGYEYFLYYNSGSAFSYPKSNTTPPYTLYSTGSTEVLEWLGSATPSNQYYGGLALSASNYDENNQDYLYWNIPEYLRDDPNNANYDLFIDMIGQHFDNIWIYTKDIVNKFDGDNRLDYGISKDLVADAIKDFGIKLYSNNFNTNDLYEAFLGITSTGNTFPSTGSEHIDNQISASSDIIPLDDTNKRLYKRIYHNIPYLLKTKGTIAGLRALITSYGIPDTILRINEFGGKNKINKQDWDYKQNTFNYSYTLDGTNYFSSSFEPNSNFDSGKPNTIQFRFKTPGIPSNHLSQSLWSIETTGDSALVLEYTGSSNNSGSYSGAIADPNNKYGTLKFIPNTSTPNINASLYLPFFDEGWWSIMTTQDNTTATVFAANKIENKLGFTGSNSITGYNASPYNSGTKILFPNSSNLTIGSNTYTPFSGSIQEIRYYSPTLSQSAFDDYTLNPLSFKGNGVNTYDQLIFRADLGTLSSTGSRTSIHPKVTGSWGTTSSFSNTSNFFISEESFSSNTEYVYLNQVPQGIKNKVSDKISIFENIIPSGDTLSPKRSIQQYSYLTQSTTPDADYLEVAFSPTDQINDDIVAELGNFNIGDYIGDPRQLSESRTNYPDLDTLRDKYFQKYIKSYDVKDFIRLIKYFDNSLFKMIKDFTPARTNLSTGVIVKQHLLERNAYSSRPISYEDQTYSGSVKSFPRGYNTGSGDTGKYETISGSSIYVFKGGTGGMFERFNGLDFSPSGSDSNGPNNRFGITQSWDEDIITNSGSTIYVRDDQREFYNGEFSGSTPFVKLQRGTNVDPCYPFLNWENIPEFLYRLEYFSGSDNNFLIEPYTPPPTIVLNEYYANVSAGNGFYIPSEACGEIGSISIFSNVSDINNITINTPLYIDVAGKNKWLADGKWYGLRISSSADTDPISFSVKINNSGIVSDKRICKFPVSFTVVEYGNEYNSYEVDYDSIYSEGDYVNISNDSGCYRITSTNFSPSGVEFTDGNITGTCTPSSPTEEVYLAFSTNPNLVCSTDEIYDYYIDGSALLLATKLYTVPEGTADYYADPGYYASTDSSRYYRYWDGEQFTNTYPFICY